MLNKFDHRQASCAVLVLLLDKISLLSQQHWSPQLGGQA
jgi:hypothetical protein